ncbi:hypothetical protein LLE49_25235 [Alicyclobacillus tolerans]|uniref:hypothetical protein n=1 Tax=Alicyclobacillus tolerans TaxID=90970 RepID=UPI001F44CA45|nr:hypothetical protein [Alicyclobacillus tolerans]MCF8568033.1 hypothetical protein [Alicyclobacillus tolerans]
MDEKQLVFLQNERPVTDSLTVDEVFEKEHRRVMQDIREQDVVKNFDGTISCSQLTLTNAVGNTAIRCSTQITHSPKLESQRQL